MMLQANAKFRKLLQPYPLESFKARLIIAALISLFVYLFLVTLEPFHLNLLEDNKALIILGYGTLCFAVLTIFYAFLPVILPSVFNEERWMVYKEIVWIVCCLAAIGLMISIYEDIIGTRPIGVWEVFDSMLKTTVIAIIPLSALVFYNQIRLLKKHLKEANSLSEKVVHTSGSSGNVPQSFVTFKSEGKQESYSCSIDNLLSVSATGNYIVIYAFEDGKKAKVLLRSTLAAAEAELDQFPEIFRCHRAHLVNLNKIKKINGNARGYDLHFEMIDLTIPVSKRKTIEFREKMNGR